MASEQRCKQEALLLLSWVSVVLITDSSSERFPFSITNFREARNPEGHQIKIDRMTTVALCDTGYMLVQVPFPLPELNPSPLSTSQLSTHPDPGLKTQLPVLKSLL